MKAKEISEMNEENLNTRLEELRKELVKHNTQIATGTTPKSPGQLKQIKKNIAKILTILHEKNKGTKKEVRRNEKFLAPPKNNFGGRQKA